MGRAHGAIKFRCSPIDPNKECSAQWQRECEFFMPSSRAAENMRTMLKYLPALKLSFGHQHKLIQLKATRGMCSRFVDIHLPM